MLARIQLALLRRLNATQALVEAKVAAVQAVPERLAAKVKRLLYVAPFYARAAVELAAEDFEAKYRGGITEAQRRIDDAPRYYTERLAALQAAAQQRASSAVDELIAAPDKLANEVAENVKAALEEAQATVDNAVGQAKAKADDLKQ